MTLEFVIYYLPESRDNDTLQLVTPTILLVKLVFGKYNKDKDVNLNTHGIF